MNNTDSSQKRIGFIVEGFNDEKTVLKAFPDAKFVVTKGTRYNNRVRMDISELLTICDNVFILTDPDEEGERIAQTILKEFRLPRILIDEKEAKCLRNRKLKTGVEHCDVDYLKSTIHSHIEKTSL